MFIPTDETTKLSHQHVFQSSREHLRKEDKSAFATLTVSNNSIP